LGWTNSHLHQFEQGHVLYGTSDREFGLQRVSETSTRVDQVLGELGAKLNYVYDFGDDWVHHIVVEKTLADEPAITARVTGGRRACPPEDSGGPWGYANLLAALADPAHAEHATMVEWAGGAWDAETFDQDVVNRRLARIRLREIPARKSQQPGSDLLDFLKRRGRV
jgi:hypothetical protein